MARVIAERDALRRTLADLAASDPFAAHAEADHAMAYENNAENIRLRQEIDDLYGALVDLIAKWDEVLPWINSAQGIAHAHGWRYGGPDEGIAPEFAAARAALAKAQGEERRS
jgi:hypothetical protein